MSIPKKDVTKSQVLCKIGELSHFLNIFVEKVPLIKVCIFVRILLKLK